jgi:hypothetical protein
MELGAEGKKVGRLEGVCDPGGSPGTPEASPGHPGSEWNGW